MRYAAATAEAGPWRSEANTNRSRSAGSTIVSALDLRLPVERLPQRFPALSLFAADHPARVLGEHDPAGIRHGIRPEVVLVVVAHEDEAGARRVGRDPIVRPAE